MLASKLATRPHPAETSPPPRDATPRSALSAWRSFAMRECTAGVGGTQMGKITPKLDIVERFFK